jgi:hypothetical protein
MAIHKEITTHKKYGTATLRNRSVELGITIHDNDKIEQLLLEGEDTTLRHGAGLGDNDMDYGQGNTKTWGMEEAGLSTGWDTIEDTVPPTGKVTQIHPKAHIRATSAAHAEVIQEAFCQSEDMHWVQRGHPNMIIPAPTDPTAPTPTGNCYAPLTDPHV